LAVHREHAIDALAPGATVPGSQRERTAMPSGCQRQLPSRPPRLGSSDRRGVVVSFDLADECVLGRPARLGGVASDPVFNPRVQIAGEQALRLGAQELETAGPDPPRRRPETRAAQHGRDRGGRDADPELEQLTLDTDVAPARVLPPHTHNQAARLDRERRTTRPPATASPTSLQSCPVPAAKRPRAHRKAGPALARQQAARSREQRPVDGRVPRPLPSPPQDRNLKLPLTAAASEHANEPAQEPVQQTHRHTAQSEPAPLRSPTRPTWQESSFFTPHA
jgi:hypothetical protein